MDQNSEAYKNALEEIRQIRRNKDAKEQLRRKFKVTKKEAYEKAIRIMRS